MQPDKPPTRKKKVNYDTPEIQSILDKIPGTLTYRQASEQISAIVGRKIDASNLHRLCKRRSLLSESQRLSQSRDRAQSLSSPPAPLRVSQLRGESLRPSILRNRSDSAAVNGSFRSVSVEGSSSGPNADSENEINVETTEPSESDVRSFTELASMLLNEQRLLRMELQRMETNLTSRLNRIENAVSSLLSGSNFSTPTGHRASTSYIVHEPEDPSNISLNNIDYDLSTVSSSRGRVLSQPLPLGSELFDFVMSRGKCPALRVINEDTNTVRLYRQGGKGRPGSDTIYYRCSRCDNLFGKKESTAKIKFVGGRPASTLYPEHHAQCEGLSREKADELQEKRHQKALRKSRARTGETQITTHHEHDEWVS